MYCRNCGTPMPPEANFCGVCGFQEKMVAQDSSNFGFALLGFFIPIVGLILYLVYEKETPLKAKSAGKGALAGFITNMVLGAIFFIFYFAFLFSFIYWI